MFKSMEDSITETVRESDEALTYGEVFSKCGFTKETPYSASVMIDTLLGRKNVRRLELLFENPYERAKKALNSYMFFIPRVVRTEATGQLMHANMNKKRYAPHTNLLYDTDEKILKRIEREAERKKRSMPMIASIANDFSEGVEKIYPEDVSVFLVGSGSPHNKKLFVYYGDEYVMDAVSDIDFNIFSFKSPVDLRPLKHHLDEITKRKRVMLNMVVKSYLEPTDVRKIEASVPLLLERH